MTVRLDDAIIRVTVDTESAKRALKDLEKSHGDLRQKRDDDEKKKKDADKDGKKADRGAKGGNRSFLSRQAAYTGISVVQLIAGGVVKLQQYVLPFVASMVEKQITSILKADKTGLLAQFITEEEIAQIKQDILNSADATVGEAMAQFTGGAAAFSQTQDFLKKISLLTGEVPDIADGWKFGKGVHGYNAHLFRLKQFGTRKMMEQYGSALQDGISSFGAAISK